MDTFLWILQGTLAAVFLGSGIAKSTMSRERLIATGQTGIALFPMPVVRVTAGAELLAAAGLLLPWATGVVPWLTPLAAAGLCVVMVGAAWSHTRLREPQNVAANGLLFAAALAVAIGRLAAL
ncbi:DoxX family protein [Aeromicrobium sp.]|uniref:DoxX family protein n=1 Tax=Aeromicrobium sp. TaxID=1871063 RepID=UPI003D6BAEF5